MTLRPHPFSLIESGRKTIELRVMYPDRKPFNRGDTITFTNTEDKDKKLHVRVIDVYHFPSFVELYQSLPLLECGYTEETVANAKPSDMDIYYSKEIQAKYSVVGIKIALISSK